MAQPLDQSAAPADDDVLVLDEPDEVAAPKKAPKPQIHPEFINLAEDMMETPEGRTTLENLGRQVIEEYTADLESRRAWATIHELFAKLYYQTDYAMISQSGEDRTWGATESVPILTEAVNQFAARSRKSFFANRDFVSAVPVSLGKLPGKAAGAVAPGGPDAEMEQAQQQVEALNERSDRVGKYLNYQLGVMDRNYRDNKDVLFISVALHGSHFTKTYWDPETEKPRVDNVRAVDLVVPYNVGPVDIADVPRKTHKVWTTVLGSEMLKRQGFYLEAAKPLGNLEAEESPVDKAAAEEEGLTPGDNTGRDNHAQVCLILEQHRYLEIPNPAKNAEKIIAPVIVWVDKESSKVLRLAIRYHTDDKGNPIDEAGDKTDRRVPIEFFTHYKFFKNVDGFYGYGLGHLVGNLNSASNIMLRQTMDAATLANDGNMSGFISNRLCPPDGEQVNLDLGKLKPVPDNVGNIKDGIFLMEFPGPNPALEKLMEFCVAYGQRLGGSTEAVTGTVEKVIQPMALSTLLEQSLELPSSVLMQIADRLGDELMKVYRLNRLYMQERVLFLIDDEVQAVSREDFGDEIMVLPIFDAKQATRAQKVAMAQAELQASLQNPNNQARPQVIDEAFKRYFIAMGAEDVEELIPPPPEPLRIDDQARENSLFLMPTPPAIGVFPDQDHTRHLQIIDQFMNTNYGQSLTPPGAMALQQHRQQHIAYAYANSMGVTMDENDPAAGAGAAAPGAPPAAAEMGAKPGGEGVFGPIVPPLPGTEGMGPAGNMGEAAPGGGAAAGAG